MIDKLAAVALPAVIALVGCFMLTKRDSFDCFLSGARQGLSSAVRLLPTLVALLVAVRMIGACGALELLGKALTPICNKIGVPSELLPLLITRPISGSASTAAYSELLASLGADSFPALCASVIMGSSDTVVYIIGVYFSSVGLRKSRYAYPAAFAVMFFCIFFCCLVCRLWFKS